MQELIKVVNGEVEIDSRMIAEHFQKEHKNVLADIRDEIEKLGAEGQLIFKPSSYTNEQNRTMPCFEMSEDGALQLAARYDAVARRKLIVKFRELRLQNAPKTQIEILLASAQALADQEKKMNAIERKTNTFLNLDGLNSFGQFANMDVLNPVGTDDFAQLVVFRPDDTNARFYGVTRNLDSLASSQYGLFSLSPNFQYVIEGTSTIITAINFESKYILYGRINGRRFAFTK